MEPLVRLNLKLLGVWTTPWQADSLLGALACTWARSRGANALQRDFLDPWLAGEPPFVVSDAFPGHSLPAPASVSLWWDWPADKRKEVKKRRWLTRGGLSPGPTRRAADTGVGLGRGAGSCAPSELCHPRHGRCR